MNYYNTITCDTSQYCRAKATTTATASIKHSSQMDCLPCKAFGEVNFNEWILFFYNSESSIITDNSPSGAEESGHPSVMISPSRPNDVNIDNSISDQMLTCLYKNSDGAARETSVW